MWSTATRQNAPQVPGFHWLTASRDDHFSLELPTVKSWHFLRTTPGSQTPSPSLEGLNGCTLILCLYSSGLPLEPREEQQPLQQSET
jgi:hypothetical protein